MTRETPDPEMPSWEIDDKSIRIFSAWGEDLGNGWEVGEIDSVMSWRIHPNKASTRLKSSICDKELSIRPADAVLLYLEGLITRELLEKSSCTDNTIEMELVIDGAVVLLTIEN